jgi:hypothetical protein
MKSTTSPAPVTTTEYSHSVGNGISHTWNIRSSAATAATAATVIEDFYLHGNMSSTDNRQPGHTQINKSFPRHHALVCASLGSTRELITRDIVSTSHSLAVVCRKQYTTAAAAAAARARAHAHDTRRSTHFTTISAYQKHHLVSMSGLAGLVVARWIGLRSAGPHTIKTAKTHAELTAKYIHSALACEILIGNRYYRGLPSLIAAFEVIGNSRTNVVGHGGFSVMANMTLGDVSPQNVAAAKTELVEIYAAQIDRLLDAVRQYKRGFVSIDSIRSDPEFTQLMRAYWHYCSLMMKIQNNFEESRDNYDDYYDNTKSLFVVADVVSICAMVPHLYNYDVAHLFDNSSQNYAKFVKTSKQTLVRLSNDGLTAAFLSFATIEPRMVTAEMTPKHGTKYLTTSMKSCANHIPSRHSLFGELRVKHREHIPRTADAVAADIGIPRYPTQTLNVREYSPLYDSVENIRAGRSWPTAPVITSAAKAYAARQAEAAAAAAAAEVADGWILCTRNRKRK